MQRTTIMLSPQLKRRANMLAQQRGISLGELVREGLELQLKSSKSSAAEDVFFADQRLFKHATPKNLSDHHDDYLYPDAT